MRDMRKVRTEEEQCCAYRESLARKKEALSRKKPQNVTTGCCAGKRLTCDEISKVEEEPSRPLTCAGILKKKPKRIKKPVGCSLEIDKLFSRIKPSISEREKYVNINHLVCILEAEDLVQLRKIQMIREKLEESDDHDGSEIQTDKQIPETDRKVKQTVSSTKSLTIKVSSEENGEDNDKKGEETPGSTNSLTNKGSSEENEKENDETVEQTSISTKSLKTKASSKENRAKNDLTVGGKTSEQIAENKNRDKKVKTTAGKSTLENKNECSSICSFDSEVDLSGLHLTKEDVEKIEKNREQIRQQQKSEKCESENTGAEE